MKVLCNVCDAECTWFDEVIWGCPNRCGVNAPSLGVDPPAPQPETPAEYTRRMRDEREQALVAYPCASDRFGEGRE